MYKFSNVTYRLANGTVAFDYEAAVASGMSYSIEYVPVYEEYKPPKKILPRRRKIAAA